MKFIYQINAEGYSTYLLKNRRVYIGLKEYFEEHNIPYETSIYVQY